MTTPEPHPVVLWELTRLCDLHCKGCPSGASERRDPNELSTYEAYKTIDQIAALAPRELIISGGDPLERDDVDQIIDYARRRGLEPSLVLSPTNELKSFAIENLQASGLTTVVFSIDGSIPAIHESIHKIANTFAATLRAIRWAESAGMRIEINTVVTRNNMNDLDAITELIRTLGIVRWNVHFIVPTGASRELEILTAMEVERVFAMLDEIRLHEKFAVRVVEAQHYRRFRLQRLLESRLAAGNEKWSDFSGYENEAAENPRDVLDAALDGARGFIYISHSGEVRPSEFAPHSAGNLRYRPLSAIYRNSDLFVALRDPNNLHGKCLHCDFRMLCGGSRARAYAMTGDLFGADPLCAYEPAGQPSVAFVSRGKEAVT
ncbi:MAG: radical SAM protein [Acidobacteriota bacterium]|nr:radical SAM protein [Acidobacteriota bacterium]